MKWYCSDVPNCNFLAGTTTNTWDQAADSAAGEDWTNPLDDDDSSAPYCTAPTDSTSDYACTAIKCIHQRLMNTGDSDDFQLYPTYVADPLTDSSGLDTLHIKPGMARVGINEAGCTTYCTYLQALPFDGTGDWGASGAGITFNIASGAETLLAGLAAITLLATTFF